MPPGTLAAVAAVRQTLNSAERPRALVLENRASTHHAMTALTPSTFLTSSTTDRVERVTGITQTQL